MKSCSVDYITSNEQHVRMMIFDGNLNIDDAAAELLRIERAQHDATRARVRELENKLSEIKAVLRPTETGIRI